MKQNIKEKELKAVRQIVRGNLYFVISDTGESLFSLLEKEPFCRGAGSYIALTKEDYEQQDGNYSIGPFFLDRDVLLDKNNKIYFNHFTFHEDVRKFIENNLKINLHKSVDLKQFIKIVESAIKIQNNLTLL